MIWIRQHEYIKRKSCLVKSITFNDEITNLMYEGIALDTAYLDFSKALDAPIKLMDKLLSHGFDEQTVWWIENWLKAGPRG